MNGRRGIRLTVLGLAGMVTAGCATMMAETPSLYERLGGKEAIHTVVDDFAARLAADASLSGRFKGANVARLKVYLTEQICEATGGPCSYLGKDMKAAHAGMGITTVEFDAVVKHLVATLDKFKVPAEEKNELLALLGPMRKDIVEKP